MRWFPYGREQQAAFFGCSREQWDELVRDAKKTDWQPGMVVTLRLDEFCPRMRLVKRMDKHDKKKLIGDRPFHPSLFAQRMWKVLLGRKLTFAFEALLLDVESQMKYSYEDYRNKRYVPKKENEFVWLLDPDNNQVSKALVFREATYAEKAKYIEDNKSFLEPGQELDPESVEMTMKSTNYLFFEGEGTRHYMVDQEFIIAPAHDADGEPIDVMGKLLVEDE